jgi:hypothetical protein
MTKQNSVLETLKKMNTPQQEENEMSNEHLQHEIYKEQLRQLKELNEGSKKPSLTVYLLLALFLGGIGAHDFYVGKPVKGLIKLVFCWTGIPTIISLFNIIGALINKDDFK